MHTSYSMNPLGIRYGTHNDLHTKYFTDKFGTNSQHIIWKLPDSISDILNHVNITLKLFYIFCHTYLKYSSVYINHGPIILHHGLETAKFVYSFLVLTVKNNCVLEKVVMLDVWHGNFPNFLQLILYYDTCSKWRPKLKSHDKIVSGLLFTYQVEHTFQVLSSWRFLQKSCKQI